jgi:hypothetical protein
VPWVTASRVSSVPVVRMALVGLLLVGTKRNPIRTTIKIATIRIQLSQSLLIASKQAKLLEEVASNLGWHGGVVWQVFLSVNRVL